MAKQIRAQFLNGWEKEEDWKGAPHVVTLTYGEWSILYIKGLTGYSGRINDRGTGKTLGFRHNITLRGENREYISPAVVTNGIAKQKGMADDKGWVSKSKYLEAIAMTLDTIISAALSGTNSPRLTGEEIHKKIEAPEWLILGEGETKEENLLKVALAGVPEYIVEFCQTAEFSLDINVEKLIQQRVNPRYNIVQKGAWDDRSQTISKTLNLPASLCILARENGLRIETKSAFVSKEEDKRIAG